MSVGTWLAAVVKRDSMLRFREEQPAFNQNAGRCRQCGSERQQGAGSAASQHPGERKQDERSQKPTKRGDAAQLGGVPARNPITHLSEQVILLCVRWIERSDRAVSGQSRRRC